MAGIGDEYIKKQVVEEGLDESATALETALSEYSSLLTNVASFFVQKGFRHIRYSKLVISTPSFYQLIVCGM